MREVNARLTDGSEIYPHRNDLSHLPFWKCDTCLNYVGCHHKTAFRTKPLGCIPNERMKTIRRDIHKLMDPLWKNNIISRNNIYKILSIALEKEYHTAEIRTIEEAKLVYKLLLSIKEYKLRSSVSSS